MKLLGPPPPMTTTDDRGQSVIVRGPDRSRADLRLSTDQHVKQLWQFVWEYCEAPWRAIFALHFVLCSLTFVTVVFANAIVMLEVIQGGSSLAAILVMYLVALAAVIVLWGRSARARARRVLPLRVATMLAHSRCPQCRRNIGSLAVEGDGCVVCPDCFSAWRASRVRLTHEEADVPFAVQTYGRFDPNAVTWSVFGQFVDERGVIVSTVPLRLSDITPSVVQELGHQRLHGMFREVRAIGRWGRLAFLVILSAAIAFSWWRSSATSPGPASADQAVSRTGVLSSPMEEMMFVVGVLMVTVVAGVCLVPRPIPKRIHTMLRYRICPSCISDLGAAETDASGHTVCRLCMSAWRLPEKAQAQVQADAITPA